MIAPLAVGTLFAANLLAGEIDERVFRVIGPEVRVVAGIHVARCRQFPLDLSLPGNPVPEEEPQPLHQLMLWLAAAEHRSPVAVLIGPPTGAGEGLQRLDALTAIVADPEAASEASNRYSRDTPLTALATAAKQMSETYDCWMVAERPFDTFDPQGPSGLKYADQLPFSIERLSAGVRTGPILEVGIEVTTARLEDARALEGIGHFLPGIVQWMARSNPFALTVDKIENFSVRASGNIVTVSFTLPLQVLEELRKSQQVAIE